MRTTVVLGLTGLCCLVGGAGLVILFVSHGGCLGDGCNGRALPGTAPGELPWGIATALFLVAASGGLFLAARRRIPVRTALVAAAVCAASGAAFAAAAAVTVARTGGGTWLMPVFVFPALLLLTVAGIIVGVVVLRAELVPRWIAVAWIVTACLLPLFNQQSPLNFIPALQGLVCMTVGAHLVIRGGQSARQANLPRTPAMG